MQVVHKEDLLCKIKVAVAWPLPDEKALWGGDAQAVQGDVDDSGLANKRRHVPEGGPAWRQPVCHTAGAAGSFTEPASSRPARFPVPPLRCPVRGWGLGAGQTAGDRQ